MTKYLLTGPLIAGNACTISAQQQHTANNYSKYTFKDCLTVSVHPSYNNGDGVHRSFWGENHRKEWSMPLIIHFTSDISLNQIMLWYYYH
ncbi:hypothetical protein ACFFGT_17350 [Mucilaginibacter angelicae]|uniref:Uncharacterized protein n=1 Tax=Mucilaginibacter angelicae TaxID=869718 RepID=A0ABV6L945_9SPHI